MALKINDYVLPNGKILENAYLRIQKIVSANVDFEFFEISDKPDVDQELKWLTKYENSCTVYVWADEHARKNRARSKHWFHFDFEYNPDLTESIYAQAYQKLNEKFGNNGVNV